MIIPYQVDVPFDHRPFINWLIIVSVVATFGMQISVGVDIWGESGYVLESLNPKGLLGHMWLHGGIIHILGNMIFLWVFGNAVCSKLGNLMYPGAYLLLGMLSGITHLIFNGNPAIGASGAINGIVGMYLVFYPLNNISCLWIIFVYYGTTFTLSSVWMILFWLAFDIFGAIDGGGRVAYYAHLGGFAAGVVLAITLLKLGVVKMSDDERSLLEIFIPKEEGDIFNRAVRDSDENDYDFERSGPGVEVDYNDPFDDVGAVMRTRAAVSEADRRAVPVQGMSARPRFEPNKAVRQVEENKADGKIRFSCHCGKAIKVDSKHAGGTGKCPGCGERILIPRQ